MPHSFLTGDVVGAVAVFYKRQKMIIAGDARTLAFSEQRGDVLNCVCPRGFQVTPLQLVRSRLPLMLVHVHTNCMGNPEHKMSQISQALDTAGARMIHASGESALAPLFLCGDFNCDAKDPCIGALSTTYNFLDTYVQAGGLESQGATWAKENELTQGFMRGFPDIRCDMILCRPNTGVDVEFVQSRVVLRARTMRSAPLSDHYGVLSTVRIRLQKPGRA